MAIGHQAATALAGGNYNIAIGKGALQTEDLTHGTVAIGYETLQDQNSTLANNVAIGYQAAVNLSSGTDSVYMGHLAGGAGVITGDNNVAIGKGSLTNATGVSNSVYIGFTAGGLGVATGDGNVAVGSGAGYSSR